MKTVQNKTVCAFVYAIPNSQGVVVVATATAIKKNSKKIRNSRNYNGKQKVYLKTHLALSHMLRRAWDCLQGEICLIHEFTTFSMR